MHSHCPCPCHPVKDLESLSDLILRVLVVGLQRHHHQELGEVNHPGAVLGGESEII